MLYGLRLSWIYKLCGTQNHQMRMIFLATVKITCAAFAYFTALFIVGDW